MQRRGVVLAAAALAIAAFAATVLPSAAQEPPPPIATEVLTDRATFPDDVDLKLRVKLDGHDTAVVHARDPSRTLVARFTVQPGAQFPWHTHAGPVVVNVTQGELVYVGAEDCAARSYPAGEAFVDAGHGHVHTAYNPRSTPTVIVATFFEAPASGPLVIPAEAPADCSV